VLQTAWSSGPPKWFYTTWGVALATTHLVLAGLNVGRFFELWEAAWMFYATLIGITSAGAVILHATGRSARAPLITSPTGDFGGIGG